MASTPHADRATSSRLINAWAGKSQTELAAAAQDTEGGPLNTPATQAVYAGQGQGHGGLHRARHDALGRRTPRSRPSALPRSAAWKDVAEFHPVFVLNGSPDGSLFGNHATSMGFLIGRAQKATDEFAAAVRTIQPAAPIIAQRDRARKLQVTLTPRPVLTATAQPAPRCQHDQSVTKIPRRLRRDGRVRQRPVLCRDAREGRWRRACHPALRQSAGLGGWLGLDKDISQDAIDAARLKATEHANIVEKRTGIAAELVIDEDEPIDAIRQVIDGDPAIKSLILSRRLRPLARSAGVAPGQGQADRRPAHRRHRDPGRSYRRSSSTKWAVWRGRGWVAALNGLFRRAALRPGQLGPI